MSQYAVLLFSLAPAFAVLGYAAYRAVQNARERR